MDITRSLPTADLVLQFEPEELAFYLAIGAPGFQETLGKTTWAQDPDHHGGKILRLNDDGTTLADNPFVGRACYRPEIFALGIRNAIGIAFRPETGQLSETETALKVETKSTSSG